MTEIRMSMKQTENEIIMYLDFHGPASFATIRDGVGDMSGRFPKNIQYVMDHMVRHGMVKRTKITGSRFYVYHTRSPFMIPTIEIGEIEPLDVNSTYPVMEGYRKEVGEDGKE